MKIKDQAVWDEFVRVNSEDDYSRAVVTYAERWADLMETKIAQGISLEEIAFSTGHEADTEGITGFMYGCAVFILSKCWEHGEQLRVWHNKDWGQPENHSIAPYKVAGNMFPLICLQKPENW